MEYKVPVNTTRIPVYSWQSNSSTTEKKHRNFIPDCDREFLENIKLLIERNLDNAEFGNDELAKDLHLSVSQLFRKIKYLTGKSTSNFIRSIRLTNAVRMLRDSECTIAEIAFKTGFNDPSYFTRTFVKEFGITPGKLRDNRRKQTHQ